MNRRAVVERELEALSNDAASMLLLSNEQLEWAAPCVRIEFAAGIMQSLLRGHFARCIVQRKQAARIIKRAVSQRLQRRRSSGEALTVQVNNIYSTMYHDSMLHTFTVVPLQVLHMITEEQLRPSVIRSSTILRLLADVGTLLKHRHCIGSTLCSAVKKWYAEKLADIEAQKQAMYEQCDADGTARAQLNAKEESAVEEDDTPKDQQAPVRLRQCQHPGWSAKVTYFLYFWSLSCCRSTRLVTNQIPLRLRKIPRKRRKL